MITAVQAWPSFFGEPQDDGRQPGFALERATPESFAADMAALVQSSSRVTLREPQGTAVAQAAPEHAYVPDAEWT